ncbi:hypothetical protein SAMN05443667_12011 [Flavobacterium gillisiae]|uniref:Ribbon-helix-helix protein, copG family n=1 Tax=Flavobacterium gillisiae TaxID=150146 RepID=A0A1H4GDL0_9FLAO|nr:hypothetical protein [Flavobacterium gillisiae]SEB06998.1 hypothetical protein SAMN05443667_12011 [Flavobacterium gillisiae]
MKTVILNVRVSEETRDALIEESSNKGISISENIRAILSNHIKEDIDEENTDFSAFANGFYNSNEFLYLITWIYDKKGQPQDNSEKHILIELKNILLRVIKDNALPKHLIEEFENVLVDLIRVINQYNPGNNQFKFCKLFENESFDYSGFSAHIASKGSITRIYI